jgi:hypothetical protein
MKFRIILIVSVLAGGTVAGGWWGLYSGLLLLGILGVLIGPPKPKAAKPFKPHPDEGVPARQGRNHRDPTRPTEEDWGGMITNYVHRQKG